MVILICKIVYVFIKIKWFFQGLFELYDLEHWQLYLLGFFVGVIVFFVAGKWGRRNGGIESKKSFLTSYDYSEKETDITTSNSSLKPQLQPTQKPSAVNHPPSTVKKEIAV